MDRKHQSHISFFTRQQSLSPLCLFLPEWCCYTHKWRSSKIIWCNMAIDSVLFVGIWVSYLLIWSMAADKYYTCSPIVREPSVCWTLSFILFHCLWLSGASTFFHLSLQPLVLSAPRVSAQAHREVVTKFHKYQLTSRDALKNEPQTNWAICVFFFFLRERNGQRVLLSAVEQPSVAPLAWMQREHPENVYLQELQGCILCTV